MEPSVSSPLVPASVTLPEITIKSVVLSVILAAILAGANAYLGLFAGMTVSASIPAAVASMAILRVFRRSNILENNIVQTAASSGEALAAGVIFTVPALILVGHWTTFDYWLTLQVSLIGGLLGVLFTIPLRRALIVTAQLRFPEGVATAEVLRVGAAAVPPAAQFRTLLYATCLGGLLKFGESGARLWSDALEGTVALGRSTLYAGMNLSPALLAVGYIIGLRTSAVVFLGGILGWLILAPLYQLTHEAVSSTNGLAGLRAVWSGQVRYVGIGAMLIGGLWTLFEIRQPVGQSLAALMTAYRQPSGRAAWNRLPRTERDAPLPWIVVPFILVLVPMGLVYYHVIGHGLVAVALTGTMVIVAFLFSAVAAYMAGLVGSSSNPVSGVAIGTIMVASAVLLVTLGAQHPGGSAAALLVGAVVCCAAAMGGDNLQDLKTGHLVGSTPWKQQIMQVVGVATASLVIVPVLSLLQAKYGIGEASSNHAHPLAAPQATLMATLAQGVFRGGLPWSMVGLGVLIGIVVIVGDRYQAARRAAWRLPVLGVALGMYLPLKLSATIFIGGILAEVVSRAVKPLVQEGSQSGLLCAAGLVTGEALMGILLAVPVALSSLWPAMPPDPFLFFPEPPWGAWPGVLAFGMVALYLVRAGLVRR
jgi:putative OPT family oligopeptide transporter